jgi:hypothetical protein
MVLLGDEAELEARFGPFGDIAYLDARQVRSLRRTYHRFGKSFWTHPMVLLGDVGHLEPLLKSLEIVLILTQDRCTVCPKHTIGSKNVLDVLDGTPR